MKYYDKHGARICEGMHIKMEDGSTELVYATSDGHGNPDLGINASNEGYLKRTPCASREYYSLSNFDMRKVEIVREQLPVEDCMSPSM